MRACVLHVCSPRAFVVRASCVCRACVVHASCVRHACVVRASCVRRACVRTCSACVRGNLWELMGTSCVGTYGNLWELYAWVLMGTYGNLWELLAWDLRAWELTGTPCVDARRFTQRFCVAPRFYFTLLRCKTFSHCGFTLCYVLELYMFAFYKLKHKFSEP